MKEKYKKDWEEYIDKELLVILPILSKLGFEIEREQPHIKGERYLMQAVTTTSGKKLILLGKRTSDNKRVVIKTTRDRNGIDELERERVCRKILQKIKFAYKTFLSPEEIVFAKVNGYTISIQEFIKQEKTFLERPIEEQFKIAIKAFEAQEGAHATTYNHIKIIKNTFGTVNAKKYIDSFNDFKENILKNNNDSNLKNILENAQKELLAGSEIIEQYTGFLTHTDFVPHNIRIQGENIYLLDHSSLRFGNKYEGWARFCNFMSLYNPPLENALVRYVKDNRTEEESVSLKLMRIYRLGEIIWYYTNTLNKSYGNLFELNKKRVELWIKILESIVLEKPLPLSFIENYKKERDSLRSEDEKIRQIGLH